MSRYDAFEDPACYPGTSVLINSAGLRGQEALDQFEQLMFLSRAEEDLPEGELDYAHYQAIHHHFFQDVYDWAGQTRTVRTAKGGNWFCYPEFIETEMTRLFAALAEEDHLIDAGRAEFITRAAHYLAEINAVHPFREGNGRCQLTLLTILVETSGRVLDEDRLEPEPFMAAMIESFSASNHALERCIDGIVLEG